MFVDRSTRLHKSVFLLTKGCDVNSHPLNMQIDESSFLIFFIKIIYLLCCFRIWSQEQHYAFKIRTQSSNFNRQTCYWEQAAWIQTLRWFWLVVSECLQAIFVPKTLFRRTRLLFLGDRTDGLLCLGVGRFCLFSLAVFSVMVPPQTVYGFTFVDVVY